eukprot:TRINITY_DN22272_c0_g1_i1.p1 TRINITY_DN22272_c0_g1~~TRINITY_DN22272_c0_g1_i1.p1  ORF type:complete len:202 (-),score=42.56 TRINITY_DN22272_c0_g1_i1:400-1005(-)
MRYVTCFTTLHWLKEPDHAQELAIVNCAESLEEGGQLFLVHFLGLDDRFMELEAPLLRDMLGPRARVQNPYVSMFSSLPAERRLEQFRGLFEAVDLEAQMLRVEADKFPLGKDQIEPFMRAASQHVSSLPETMQATYLKRWVEESVKRNTLLDKGSSYEFSTVAIVAVLRKRSRAPSVFYDILASKCREGVIRLDRLENFR